jgi:hypothetical protein
MRESNKTPESTKISDSLENIACYFTNVTVNGINKGKLDRAFLSGWVKEMQVALIKLPITLL